MNIDAQCINKANQYKFYKQRTSSMNRDFQAYSFKAANDHHHLNKPIEIQDLKLKCHQSKEKLRKQGTERRVPQKMTESRGWTKEEARREG